MEWVTSPVELTTAITDALLALEMGVLIAWVQRYSRADKWKARLWQIALALLGMSSFLGAIYHGIVLTLNTQEILWTLLNFAATSTMALFLAAAIYDAAGSRAAKRALPILLGLIAVVFGLTLLKPNLFLIVILYAVVVGLIALAIYAFLAWRRMPGAAHLTLGIVLSILASAIQASGPSVIPTIWFFDHNGFFHVVMMVAVAVIVRGVVQSLRLRGRAPAGPLDVSPDIGLNAHHAD